MTPELPRSPPDPSPNPYEPPGVPSAANEEEERLRQVAGVRFGTRLALAPPLVGAVVSLLPLLVYGPLRRSINRLLWPHFFLVPLDWELAIQILGLPIFFVAIWVMQLSFVKWLSSDGMRFAGILCLVVLVPVCIAIPFAAAFWSGGAPVNRVTSWVVPICMSGLFSSVFLASGLGLLRLARARRLRP